MFNEHICLNQLVNIIIPHYTLSDLAVKFNLLIKFYIKKNYWKNYRYNYRL